MVSAVAARVVRAACVALPCVLPALAEAQLQAWSPSRAVEIISSTGAGGEQDRVARAVQGIIQNGRLSSAPLVVVNKPGGGGALSVAYLNRIPGDGHALLVASALILSSQIMGQASFTLADMRPVARLFHEYAVLVVGSGSPLRSAGDVIARLKSAPDSISIGVSVLGTAHHLSIARAAKAAGVNPKSLKMVTFKSGTDALIATLGGHIDASVSSASNIQAALESGAVRALAISAPNRMPGALANVPTWKELGVDSVTSNFRMVFGPRGMTDAQVAYWEQALSKVVASDAWTKEVEAHSWVPGYLNSAQSQQWLAAEYDALKAVLTELGMAKQ